MDTIRREAGPARGLGSFDVLVCGGGLSGWAAAVMLGREGRQVLLAAERTALGREVWAALSLWLSEAPDARPGLLRELLDGLAVVDAVAGATLDPVATEVVLDRMADEAGVRLLFQVRCHPDGEQWLVAGKWGLMAACAGVIVDATPEGLGAAEAGGAVVPRGTGELPIRRALIINAECDAPISLSVPRALPISDGRVTARPGRWRGDAIIEARLDLDAEDPSVLEIESRRALTEVAAYLRAQQPGFAASSLVQVAHDAVMPRSYVIAAGTSGEGDLTLATDDGPVRVRDGALLPEATQRLLLASPAADLGAVTGEECCRPENAIRIGETAARLAASMLEG
ncbi:MAG TPA: FAD-dependent oxidoreductase [Armatimonadota bacterium]|nr:FAD-dependent oxidoreductase [Armatimonadota bacterium]